MSIIFLTGRNDEAQFGGFLKKVEKGQDRHEVYFYKQILFDLLS